MPSFTPSGPRPHNTQRAKLLDSFSTGVRTCPCRARGSYAETLRSTLGPISQPVAWAPGTLNTMR
eukprot:6955849-Pyramimonas_sp.AAC.1